MGIIKISNLWDLVKSVKTPGKALHVSYKGKRLCQIGEIGNNYTIVFDNIEDLNRRADMVEELTRLRSLEKRVPKYYTS